MLRTNRPRAFIDNVESKAGQINCHRNNATACARPRATSSPPPLVRHPAPTPLPPLLLLLAVSATKSSTSTRCAASKLLLRSHPRDTPGPAAGASGSTGVAPPAVAGPGQPGDRSRPPEPATATNANNWPPEVGVSPNRVDNKSAASCTAATRSAHPDPAEAGICTSTSAVTAFCRKKVRATSSRPAARRNHPRTVDAGTDNTAPIRR